MAEWRLPFPDSKITGHYGTLSEFRKKNGMQAHSGTDWAMPKGHRIPAITKGTVSLVQFSKALGWVLCHTAITDEGEIYHIGYCHMDTEPTLKVGDKITMGQTIGYIGNTGQSSGPHLHATAGKSAKSVFGPTDAKVDLYKLIKSQLKEAK